MTSDSTKTFSGLSLSAQPKSGHKKTGYLAAADFFGIVLIVPDFG
jgi:hypothetical protein